MFASSLLLDGRSTRHLIDATPDVRFQIRGDALDGVFLTHEHLGHLPGLLYFGPEGLAATGLTVHCTPRLGEFIATNDPFARLSEEGRIVLDPVRPGSTVDIRSSTARSGDPGNSTGTGTCRIRRSATA
jgi:pyrroloquinoline quinone biosynthesis protein B